VCLARKARVRDISEPPPADNLVEQQLLPPPSTEVNRHNQISDHQGDGYDYDCCGDLQAIEH
jgi:hypothetical protein